MGILNTLHLNQQEYGETIISHKTVIEGAKLEYSLSNVPNKNWGIHE